MADHQHIILEGQSSQVDYETTGFPRSKIIGRENELAHSAMLNSQYSGAIDLFAQSSDLLPEHIPHVDGTYLDITVEKSANATDKFDAKRGPRVMNIGPSGNDQEERLTVFLPTRQSNWLSGRLEKYNREPGEGSNRANATLVNSISCIRCSELRSFFQKSTDFDSLSENASEYELWIDKELYDSEGVETSLDAIGVVRCMRNLVFNDIVVYLVVANQEQLSHVIHSIKGVSEIRVHRRPNVLTRATGMQEQDEWVDLIKQDCVVSENLSRVAVLDSGITNHHPLIDGFLPNDRCHSVTINGNIRDLRNHGTGLASLVLYGDLTDAIYQQNHVEVYSDLSSVKMIPGADEPQNEPEMYAVVTEDAIVTGRDDEAEILCSAVTSGYRADEGIPSSTSAAIDLALYNNGACDSMMFISAGNVEETSGLNYPDYLHVNPIDDPAQTWNAITVGAYTKKVAIADPQFRNAQVIAPYDGISPYSRTSMQWGKSIIKPEILMEGGNGILNGNRVDAVDDLSLVCADAQPLLRKFTTTNATSAATALAARLAGKIKNANPGLSPLSIRALMIHSAEWTDRMKDLFTENGSLNKLAILHTCGYGVPVERKALTSTDSYVTFIAEDTIKPYVRGANNNLKFGHMNLYELPWPKETLLQMGEVNVRLKITLSYYICPSPGARRMLKKYTYQSLRLNFDINGPTEDIHAFENRIKRIKENEEDRVADPGLNSRWTIGKQMRNQGSVISDSIELTAAQLASCNIIAIYPSSGWFRNNLDYEHAQVKYSLVVSLETPEQEIFSEIANKIGIALPIEA